MEPARAVAMEGVARHSSAPSAPSLVVPMLYKEQGHVRTVAVEGGNSVLSAPSLAVQIL
jgi:hypothetical protein